MTRQQLWQGLQDWWHNRVNIITGIPRSSHLPPCWMDIANLESRIALLELKVTALETPPNQPIYDPCFEGFEHRCCGEHRTTGDRAWCFADTEWCYPDDPCRGCKLGDGGHPPCDDPKCPHCGMEMNGI